MMVVRTLDERKHSIVNRLWLRCKVYSPNLLLSTNEPLIELISAKERFFLTVMPSAASSIEPFNYCSNNPSDALPHFPNNRKVIAFVCQVDVINVS